VTARLSKPRRFCFFGLDHHMSNHDAFTTAQARCWLRPNAHLYVRPDAWRFMPAGAPKYFGKDAVRYFWPGKQPPRRNDRAPDVQAEELRAERDELLRLRGELLAVKADIKWRRLCHTLKYNFNPAQPRVEAGNLGAGQWTRDGSAAGERRIRLAGEIPTNEPPEIPPKRPVTAKERNRIARSISRNPLLRGNLGLIFEIAKNIPWVQEKIAEIVADQDPPKTLEELQEAAKNPRPGYDVHHIVEQTAARKAGFSEEMIEAPENKVLIPRFQHWRVTGWFAQKNEEFSGMSPREYLQGKTWDERRRAGLKGLANFGVLKR
jgi:hypothetical protein